MGLHNNVYNTVNKTVDKHVYKKEHNFAHKCCTQKVAAFLCIYINLRVLIQANSGFQIRFWKCFCAPFGATFPSGLLEHGRRHCLQSRSLAMPGCASGAAACSVGCRLSPFPLLLPIEKILSFPTSFLAVRFHDDRSL